MSRYSFQSLILGDQQIETETQKRKILLGAYLILMYLGIDGFFFIVSLFNSHGTPYTLFAGAAISVGCLLLLSYKWVETAIFIHLARCNAFAFYFSYTDDDPYLTGVYVYFVPACLGALAIFGYQERWKGIGFTLVSFILFLMAFLVPSRFSLQDPHFYFITNFLVILIIGLLILLFFDRMVIETERTVLRKNVELSKTNAELDRFVYSVSHDLRAPLSSILGLVQIYRFSEAEIERKEIVDHIQVRALKMDKFIGEILDYSRNSRMEVNMQPVPLRQMINDVLDGLGFSSGMKNIQALVEVPEDYIVFSDQDRLKVIFNNLISNAIKYQDYTKTNAFVRITVNREKDTERITVEDNGVGIRVEYQAKLFNMFYRANDTVEGSGLGLYIVRETVEKLGGKIYLASEFAKGTTFRVTLPANQNEKS